MATPPKPHATRFVPPLNWVERAYRQAKKHVKAAAPTPLAQLLWAWGEWGYSPRDKPFVNLLKIALRRMLRQRQLSGRELVMVMHGLSRMEPAYWPNEGWMMVFVAQVRPHLRQLPPGDVVELLLSLVSMGHRPPAKWVDAALARLQQALELEAATSAPAALPSRRSAAALLPSSSRAAAQEQPQLLPDEFETEESLQQVAQLLEAAEDFDVDAITSGSLPEARESAGSYRVPQALQAGQDAAAGESSARTGSSGGSSSRSSSSSLSLTAPAGGEALVNQQEQQQQQQQQEEEEEEEEGQQEQGAAEEAEEEQEWDPAEVTLLVAEATAAAAEAEAASQQQRTLDDDNNSSTTTNTTATTAASLTPLGPRQLAITAWCLGALDFIPPQPWLQAFSRSLIARADQLGPNELADVLHGLAGIDSPPGPALSRRLVARSGAVMGEMGEEALARTCRALVRLGIRPAAAGAAAALLPAAVQPPQQQRTRGRRGKQQSVVEGEQAASSSSSSWPDGLERALMRLNPQLTTAHVADILGLAAWAGFSPSPAAVAAAAEAAAAAAPSAHPTAIVGALWALARLSYKPPPQLLHALLSALRPRLNVLGCRDTADAAWALCVLRHRPGAAWLGAYMGEVAARAGYMSSRELTDSLWALACFGAKPDEEWLRRVAAAAAARLGNSSGSSSSGGGEEEEEAAATGAAVGDAAVLVWALRELGYRGGEGDGGLLDALERVLGGAGGGGGGLLPSAADSG